MNLYFAPLACSLATRISLYEAGVDAQYTYVDLKKKRLGDGTDYLRIAPFGQVAALRTDDGALITENAAILQYVADRYPHAGLAPASGMERVKLQHWLGFVGTELHQAVFIPLLDPQAPEGARSYARGKADWRLGYVQKHLEGRAFLLEGFSVADAYLFAVLNWAPAAGVDLGRWPEVVAYRERLLTRPAVARAFGEEWEMYQEEMGRVARKA